MPHGLNHIFFSDDGSTAVEVALKMAVQYWQNTGRPAKKAIVALEHAYHGDTVGAMSVGAASAFTDPFREMLFPCIASLPPTAVAARSAKRAPPARSTASNSSSGLLEQKNNEIAAVIVEPLLQGAGGMIVHPVEFLQRVRKACSEHNVLLIADEVLTGFGRCGKMFACELAGIAADLMCLSKGLTGGVLPMGATVSTDTIHERVRRQRSLSHLLSRPFLHGKSPRCGGRRGQPADIRDRAGFRSHRRHRAHSWRAPQRHPQSSRGRGPAIDRNDGRSRASRR